MFTQAICGTEKRGLDLLFVCPRNTTTMVTTLPKYWHYCTCSGSCRGTELMGALFSTLPSIYKHNTVFPHIITLALQCITKYNLTLISACFKELFTEVFNKCILFSNKQQKVIIHHFKVLSHNLLGGRKTMKH
jgi:hypothetical protein